MSSSATPLQAPDPNHSALESIQPPGSDLPHDPLLDSGSFIDATVIMGETLTEAQTNGKERGNIRKTPELSENRRSSVAAETSNGGEPVTPGDTESRGKAGVRKGSSARDPDVAAKTMSLEKPNWLPEGWLVEDRVRASGATAGTVDKYYFDPVSSRRFRSRKEVLYFLETGTLRKRKKPSDNSDGDMAMDGSGEKSNKSSNNTNKTPTLNFDFYDVPEKVEWVLTDSSEGSWTPFIGEEKIAESTKQDWAYAFTLLTSRNAHQLS